MFSIIEDAAPPHSAPWAHFLPEGLPASPRPWLPRARNIDPCRDFSPPVLPPSFARLARLRVLPRVLWPRFIISKSVTIVPENGAVSERQLCRCAGIGAFERFPANRTGYWDLRQYAR